VLNIRCKLLPHKVGKLILDNGEVILRSKCGYCLTKRANKNG